MSIVLGMTRVAGFSFLWLNDPNRYRVTIWKKRYPNSEIYPVHVKTMWSKDKSKLYKRVREFIDKNS